VRGHREDVAAGRAPHVLHTALEHVLATRAGRDLRAGASEPLHAREAEPFAATRDDRDLTGETELERVHDGLQVRDCLEDTTPAGSGRAAAPNHRRLEAEASPPRRKATTAGP